MAFYELPNERAITCRRLTFATGGVNAGEGGSPSISRFAYSGKDMSAQEIIEQIKALPPMERAAVARFVVQQDDSWIPDEFKEAMKDAEEGRFVDMETALCEAPRLD